MPKRNKTPTKKITSKSKNRFDEATGNIGKFFEQKTQNLNTQAVKDMVSKVTERPVQIKQPKESGGSQTKTMTSEVKQEARVNSTPFTPNDDVLAVGMSEYEAEDMMFDYLHSKEKETNVESSEDFWNESESESNEGDIEVTKVIKKSATEEIESSKKEMEVMSEEENFQTPKKKRKKETDIGSDDDDEEKEDTDNSQEAKTDEIQKKQSRSRKTDSNDKSKSSKTSKSSKGISVASSEFKTVNSQSNNRRKCSRKGKGGGTPEKSNKEFKGYKYKSRVTTKLVIPASEKPQAAIIEALKEWRDEFCSCEKGCAILPWKQVDFGAGKLQKKSKFPDTLSKLRVYANRLFAGHKNRDMTIYPHIYIGHNKSFDDIKELMSSWLSIEGYTMYRNMLQVEESSEIGWLLYSTKEMDTGALADEITEGLGFAVGLRWKVIDNGTKNMAANQKVYALSVEVDVINRYACQKEVAKLYSKTSNSTDSYPNGIRLRFVKVRKDAINMTERKKMEKLRKRQRFFLDTIKTHVTSDILEIDTHANLGEPTLRQMMMSMVSQKNKVPLFHCIDLDYRRQGFVVQYSEQNAMEAECVLNTIIPYIDYLFPESNYVKEAWFDEAAIDRCCNLKFCEEQNMVVDKYGGKLGEEEESDDDLAGFTFSTDDHGGEIEGIRNGVCPENIIPEYRRNVGPYDNDSITTFGTKPSTYGLGTKKNGDNVSALSNGGASASTSASQKAFRTEMTATVTELQSENIQLRSELREMMSLLQKWATSAPLTKDSDPKVMSDSAGTVSDNSSGHR